VFVCFLLVIIESPKAQFRELSNLTRTVNPLFDR